MYEINELPNGLRVIKERIPFARSVTAGLWIGTGSMHESPEENGLSHFLEHMLFKGTQRRSARDIAEEIDAIGGQINAFTSKECTCYYAKVMDEHLHIALDVLSDLSQNATLGESELNKERSVILEEIAMVEDSPEDLAHDLLTETLFRGNPLAQPILGTAARIERYTRDDLNNYRKAHYRPGNAVLAVAGHFENDALDELIERYFGGWPKGDPVERIERERRFNPLAVKRSKDIEQVHICLGFPGVALGDEDVYAIGILNNLFGGGMSSRLFQRIREELGMAYTVYSFPTVYPGSGMFTLYAGTSPQHVEVVLSQLRKETAKLLSEGITEKEFSMAREQLKGSYILSLEGTSSRMSHIGRNLLLLGNVKDEDDVLKRIAKCTIDDVMRKAGDILLRPHGAAVVGRDAANLPDDWLLA
ncbi:MAG: insulinase family protein [Oscillospiraceae bacterium]|jgi:predicted Zn-dependent peptidase|nr:insulinase family protein [Oscillospiraceae bacterium]